MNYTKRASALIVALTLPFCAWAATPSVLVKTVTAQKKTLAETLTVFGAVQPNPDVVSGISAGFAARVAKLDVSLGQRVTQGTPLITLDVEPSAHANYEQAKAAVQFARTDLARKKQLLKQQLVTHSTVASARKALQDAESNLRTQIRLGTNKSQEVIRAPFTGVISKVHVSPGNREPAGKSLLSIARRDSLRATLGVEPEAVRQVKTGMPVIVRSMFSSIKALHAHINQVHQVINPNTRLVDVVVEITGKQAQEFIPGMNVQGRITLKSQKTVAVPRQAVLHDNKGAYVFLDKHGKGRRVNVATGIEENGLIGVRGNISAGDQVIVAGNYELHNGMAVRTGSR